MSTAELGLSLAEMIRQGKVHAISLHRREPRGGRLQPRRARPLRAHPALPRPDARPTSRRCSTRHLNRVTDTCIPEEEAMRRIERAVLDEWMARRHERASATSRTSSSTGSCARGVLKRALPDRSEGQLAARGGREEPADLRARLGGLDARQHLRGALHRRATSRTSTPCGRGIEYMMRARRLVHGRRRRRRPIGFFQIGGGIAGDFPICVVPMLHQDLRRDDVPLWGYFCQISDSTTSYGSYSRRRAEREDHLGQARRRHAEVHHRVATPRSSRR